MKDQRTAEWEDDCMKYHGRILTGKYGHWCYEWDYLPIDETCEEFQCCNCYPERHYKKRTNYLHWVFIFGTIVVTSLILTALKC